MCRNAGSRKSGNSLGNGFPAPFHCFTYCNITHSKALSLGAITAPGPDPGASINRRGADFISVPAREYSCFSGEFCLWISGNLPAFEAQWTLTVEQLPCTLKSKSRKSKSSQEEKKPPAPSLSWTDFSEETQRGSEVCKLKAQEENYIL